MSFVNDPLIILLSPSYNFLNNFCIHKTGIALIKIFLPVFYGLQVTSAFQYLEMRFNRNVRLIASLIFALSGITFIPVVV